LSASTPSVEGAPRRSTSVQPSLSHFLLDGFQGYRARFDDIRLVFELLSEVPFRLGIRPVMPPFVLPYYDGVDPDDAGISAFVFLEGGHLTVHTFSYRECFFADLVAPGELDRELLRDTLVSALPCRRVFDELVCRRAGPVSSDRPKVAPDVDFGPHFMLDLDGYAGPTNHDGVFALLDELPGRVGMTPIMRPYVLSEASTPLGPCLSGMTMIAESHIALHVFTEPGLAFFDAFSCRFFEPDEVLPELRAALPAERSFELLTSRGSGYRGLRTERNGELRRARAWLGGPRVES
jgi:S-adenosylmethionine/arginine decarboxylase-like enzyme